MRETDSAVAYIYLRRASALPSDLDKAMREASKCRTVRYRFLRFFVLTYCADERKTEAEIDHEKDIIPISNVKNLTIVNKCKVKFY